MKHARLRLRSLALVLLALMLLPLSWLATHGLADDGRTAYGVVKTVDGPVPVTYYEQVPLHPKPDMETVVLVASLGRPVSDFNELTTVLVTAGYRTLAVESRGIRTWSGGGFARYALSDLAQDIQRVLQDAGADAAAGGKHPVHILGHAFGNRVARTFATLYPGNTAGLMLVAAGDKTDNMPAAVARDLRLSTLGFLPWALRGAAVERVFFTSGGVVPAYWKTGWSSWGALAQARAARAASSESFNAGGTGPMLVLQADDDVIAPPKDAGEALKAQYGERVTLVHVPKAGHALLPEQPALIGHAVLEFLKAHPAR